MSEKTCPKCPSAPWYDGTPVRLIEVPNGQYGVKMVCVLSLEGMMNVAPQYVEQNPEAIAMGVCDYSEVLPVDQQLHRLPADVAPRLFDFGEQEAPDA